MTRSPRQPRLYATAHTPRKRQSAQLAASDLRADSSLAEKLKDTGLWDYGRWASVPEKDADSAPASDSASETKTKTKKTKTKTAGGGGTKRQRGDRNRVNIVSEKLTDDVISYLGPNFVERHRGCDILDIYPGAGLWSSKLHEALQPRSHILMEPDAEFYKDFLKDLVAKPNVTLVPLSGIIWRNLTGILNEQYLPHQVEIVRPQQDGVGTSSSSDGADNTKPLPRNDTLLVTANLAFFPQRRFGMFDSVSQLVLYQFINSIRATSLFHKYGLVRMLIWVEDNDRHALIARSCQRRRRLALDGEMATEWINELTGRDVTDSDWYRRDHALDLESCRRVLRRMKAEGVEIPAGRETRRVKEVRAMMAADEVIDFSAGPKFNRPYLQELEELEKFFKGKTAKAIKVEEVDEDGKEDAEEFAEEDEDAENDAEDTTTKTASKKVPKRSRLLALRYRRTREERAWEMMAAIMAERDHLAKLHRPNMNERMERLLQAREVRWNAIVAEMNQRDRGDFLLYRDNLHVFRQAELALSEQRIKVKDDDDAEDTQDDTKVTKKVAKKATKKATEKVTKATKATKNDTKNDPKNDPNQETPFHQPLMSWDKRDREPLVVQNNEFFPNTECVLLDIQPKSMHPLIRAMGPGTSRAGDHFELIVKAMMAVGAEPVSTAIETVWPGAAAGVLPKCPSLYDLKQGGSPVRGPYGELSARTLNERQWVEILEAWMAWPFRPTLGELLRRVSEEGYDVEEESTRAE